MLLEIPTRAFQEDTVDVAPVFWFFSDVRVSLIVCDPKLERDLVDSDDVLTSIVLQVSSNEGLREEET